jgi:hypothetical protein
MPERDPTDRRHEEEIRPLREAGQGEAEGFEEAEEELIEHASHGDPAPDPTELAGEPEDPDREPAPAYGEADHAEASEEAEERDEDG